MATPVLADGLIERDLELATLDRVIAGAIAGRGRAVVIDGGPGIGKSGLAAEAVARGTTAGMRVLTARADVLERDFPYGVAGQLFEPALRELPAARRAELLDGAAGVAGDVLLQGALPGREASTLISHALYWLAWGLAEERPLMLCVDDAHWSDRASARALLHLARRVEDMPVLLVIAQRASEPEAPEELVSRLVGEPGVVQLSLEPLSSRGSAGLVRRWLASADGALCERCHAASGGNPLVVRELARVVAESDAGALALADDGSLAGGVHSPVLEHAVRRRLDALDPSARAVIEALTILGDGAAYEHVAVLAGVDVRQVSAARDPLIALGLLGEGAGLGFSHAVIRQAASAVLPRGETARRHRRAAHLLMGDGAPLDTVAAHLVLSDPGGDDATVGILRNAARSARERGAPDTAVAYLRRALAEPPGGHERSAVLLELATTEFDCGLQGTAARLREALAGLEDHAGRVEVLTRLAALEVLQQQGTADAQMFEDETAAVGSADPELALAIELASLDVLLMLPDRQAERQARVAALPAPSATPSQLERVALAHRAWMAAERGNLPCPDVVALGRQSLEGADLLELAFYRPTYHLAARALIVADALPQAEESLRTVEDEVIRRGSLRMRAAFAWYLSDLHFRCGRVADAENEARLVLDLHEERDLVNGGAVEALVNALVERGALDEADSVLAEHGLAGPLDDTYRSIGLRTARARLSLARGNGPAALADALDCGRLREMQGRPNPAWTAWRSVAAHAHLMLGQVDEARELADAELELARAFGAPRAIGIALRARALANVHPAERISQQREAVAVLGAGHAELEYARALVELGASLLGEGETAEAQDHLREALATSDRLGATALATRARDQLVASGLRPRRASMSGVAALTPRQRRVCELAATGATNRVIAQHLFVTVKTVETHLLAAYRKLGISSKADLATVLSDVR